MMGKVEERNVLQTSSGIGEKEMERASVRVEAWGDSE
jgi:hypothetical protein